MAVVYAYNEIAAYVILSSMECHNDRLVLRLANMVMVEVLGIDHYMSLLV